MSRLSIMRPVALTIATLFLAAHLALAQESPAPTETPQATETPLVEASPVLESSAAPTATISATVPSTRSVRISFLPPPLEGKISLGVYDLTGQLVRVLHREAGLDAFTIGADSLVTKWDGKDDNGADLPAGKYHARGFLVGSLKAEELASSAPSPPADASATGAVQLKLMANPLTKGATATVDLTVAFDDKGLFLRMADGLPLFTADQKPNVSRAWIKKNEDKSVDIFVDRNGTIGQIHISNVDKMMAFDCGTFDLK